MTTKRSQGPSCKDGVQTGSETLVQYSVAAVAPTFFLEKVAASPAPSVPLPKELPRLGYFILCCPIQPSFQRPQPCQCRACTKGLFDFLFVFICQQRGRGQERKSFWVLKFLFGLFHSRSWLPGTPVRVGGLVAGQRVPEAMGEGVRPRMFIPQDKADRLFIRRGEAQGWQGACGSLRLG